MIDRKHVSGGWKDAIRRWGGPLWWLAGRLVPKHDGTVAINAFPDFDDSTRAIAQALRGTRHRLTVLTTQRNAARPSWLGGDQVSVAHRYSLRGLWLYHRARYLLFTHGCFSAWEPSPTQVVVNIWHGMPIKRIGLLDGKRRDEIPRFHYTIAADERFQEIIAAAFGVSKPQVLIADHPRLDILRGGGNRSAMQLPPHRRLAVWLPTYRASVTGDVRVDGEEGKSIFSGGVDLARVDDLCARHQVLCVVKPHPMAKVSAEAFAAFRSLIYLDDAALAARGLSLYELLGASDLLITDVSSVYFDYQVLGKPVLLYCPDLRQYAATRGFVAPIETLVRDEIIEREDVLLERLGRWCTSTDDASKRTPCPSNGSAALSLLRRVGLS